MDEASKINQILSLTLEKVEAERARLEEENKKLKKHLNSVKEIAEGKAILCSLCDDYKWSDPIIDCDHCFNFHICYECIQEHNLKLTNPEAEIPEHIISFLADLNVTVIGKDGPWVELECNNCHQH